MRLTRAILVVLSASALATVGWSAARAGAARRSAEQARADCLLARAQAAELAELRAVLPADAAAPIPASGLPGRITTVLSANGLPSSAVSSFSGDSDGRAATLTLEPVTLPGLGRFLDAWRSAEPAWSIHRAEVAPARAGGVGGAGGGAVRDLPLRVVLVLEAPEGVKE